MPPDEGPTPQIETQAVPLPPARVARQMDRRRRLFAILGVIVLAAALVYLVYWLLVSSRHVSTDNAYVGADTAQVTALVGGAIVQAPVGETSAVKPGQVVAVIDPADYRLAVDQARAQLGQTERRVRQYFANDRALGAQAQVRGADVPRAEAQLASARADLTRAQIEDQRRRNLAASGAVSGDELTEAENRLAAARAAFAAAQSGVAQARAGARAAVEEQAAATVLVAGSGVADHPEVAAAQAKLAQAELDLQRTVVRAPVAGVVTRNTIEVGQRVAPGTVLMSLVPVQSAFVDANFKEVQLRKVRPGQPVVLTSDLYGAGVRYHGKVVGFAGGTGAAFALIPAQNATGNWIKVVQRIPVRIALDPKELAEHPLRVGLSMKADIDVGSGR